VRKKVAPDAGVFQVYSVQIGGNSNGNDTAADGGAEEMRLNYNVGGICLSEAAFRKLRQEISLAPWTPETNKAGFDGSWVDQEGEFFVGTVPIASGIFRKIAIRKNRIAQVDVRDLSIQHWTERYYYEVCANPAVYSVLENEKAATATR
jgi:hypothetical protein